MLGRMTDACSTVSGYTTSSVASFVTDYLTTPVAAALRYVTPSGMEWYEGVTQPLYPSNLNKFFRFNEVRKTLTNSVSASLIFYAGQVILIEGGMAVLRSTVPAIQSYYLDHAIEWAAYGCLCGISARLFTQSAAEAIVISSKTQSAIRKERKDLEKKYQKNIEDYYPGCGDDEQTHINATFYNATEYFCNKMYIKFLSKIIPYGEYAILPFEMLNNGRFFLRNRISTNGMCRPHQDEIINKNNAYSLGLGMSFDFFLRASRYLLSYFTGINNSFLEYAFYYPIFNYFIFSTSLIESPLPGEKEGHNYLLLIEKHSEAFIACLKIMTTPSDDTLFTNAEMLETIEKIDSILHTKGIYLLEKALFGVKIESYADMKKLGVVTEALIEFMPTISHFVKTIETKRMTFFLDKVIVANEKIPSLMSEYLLSKQDILKFIFAHSTDTLMNKIKNEIMYVELDHKLLTSPANKNKLITSETANLLCGGIDCEITRLNTEKKPVDINVMNIYLQKINALADLFERLNANSDALAATLKAWRDKYQEKINQHTNAYANLFTKTTTAQFVDQLINEIDEQTQVDGDLSLLRESLLKKINLRSNDLHAEFINLRDDYILQSKIRAFTELSSLVSTFYNQVAIEDIFHVWEKYNKHIISMHRQLPSTLLSMLYVAMTGEELKTKAEKSLEVLIKEAMNSVLMDGKNTHVENTDKIINANITTSIKHQTAQPASQPSAEDNSKMNKILALTKTFTPVAQLPSESQKRQLNNMPNILGQLQYKIAELEKYDPQKASAIKELVKMIRDNPQECTFSQILDNWKIKYWAVVCRHQTGVFEATNKVFGLFGQSNVVTANTAKFLENIEQQYGHLSVTTNLNR